MPEIGLFCGSLIHQSVQIVQDIADLASGVLYLCLGLMDLIQHSPVCKDAVKEIVGDTEKPINVDLEVSGDGYIS